MTPRTQVRREAGAAPGERIYVGIDVGYREHVAAGIPLSGFQRGQPPDGWKRARRLHFSSDAVGFRQLRRYLDQLSACPTDFLILVEPTGGYYGMALLSFLLSQRYAVLQVDNRAVKDYRDKVLGSETKTDATDARLMARMGYLHEVVGEEFTIQPIHLADPDEAALRVMVRDLAKLQTEITRRYNQLQQVVAVLFPELKTFFIKSTAGPTVRALLERYPTPHELAKADLECVAELLRQAHDYSHAKRVAELLELAKASAGVRLMVHHQWRQGWIIKQLPTLEQARAELVEQLRRATAVHPYTPILESLPVKSPIWTATLIAVIGDVGRFRTYRQFKAYLGWYPREQQSGSSVNSSRLATRAVRLSRNVLGQMSVTLLSPTIPSTPFREFYERLVARGMKPATAKGHLAGKLSVVLYSLLKTMKPYDEGQHRRALGLPVANSPSAAQPAH